MTPPALAVDRLHAVVHGPDPVATRLGALVPAIADAGLAADLTGLPAGHWCLRRLDVAVAWEAYRPVAALATVWASALGSAVHAAIGSRGRDVVHFRHDLDALTDLVAELTVGRTERAWAWMQLGLVDTLRPPAAMLISALRARPALAVPAMVAAVRRRGLPALDHLLGPVGWTAVTQPVRPYPADPSADAAVPPATRLAGRVLEASEFATAVQRSGLRPRPVTARDWAVLVTAEVDPAALDRPGAGALLAAVSDALGGSAPRGRRRPAAAEAVVSGPAVSGPAGFDPPVCDPHLSGPPVSDPAGSDPAGSDPAGFDLPGSALAVLRPDAPAGPTRAVTQAPPAGERAAAPGTRPDVPGGPEALPVPVQAGPATADRPTEPGAAPPAPATSAGLPLAAGGPTRTTEPPAMSAPRGALRHGTDTGAPRCTPDAAAPVADVRHAVDPDSPAGLPTGWAGLPFLLATAADAGLPGCALDEPDLADRPLAWVLHHVGRTLVPAGPDDAALLALAGLDPRRSRLLLRAAGPNAAERAGVARLAACWRAATAARLADPAAPHDLVHHIARRPGRVHAEPGWIEVHMPLAAVDPVLRRAGLDVDPGWVPWIGAVVRYCYE